MATRIVKLQQLVKRFGGEDKLTVHTVEASASPQQKLTRLEEMISECREGCQAVLQHNFESGWVYLYSFIYLLEQ